MLRGRERDSEEEWERGREGERERGRGGEGRRVRGGETQAERTYVPLWMLDLKRCVAQKTCHFQFLVST